MRTQQETNDDTLVPLVQQQKRSLFLSVVVILTMKTTLSSLLTLLLLAVVTQQQLTAAFAPPPTRQRFCRSALLAASSSSDDNANNKNNDSLFLASLRQRQQELQNDVVERVNKWKTADCASGVQLVLPNWVRRLDVATWPFVATGSACGDVYVGNLETGQVIAIGQVQEENKHDDDETEFQLAKRLDKVVRVLFNGYDGGGTLAMAFDGNLICEGRRSGGVYVWRWDQDSDRLVPQGSIPGVGDDTLVTALHLDQDYLWVGTVDGHLQAYSLLDDEYPLALQQTPEMAWQFGETITDLSIHTTSGAVATAAGAVHLFSLEDEEAVLGSFFSTL